MSLAQTKKGIVNLKITRKGYYTLKDTKDNMIVGGNHLDEYEALQDALNLLSTTSTQEVELIPPSRLVTLGDDKEDTSTSVETISVEITDNDGNTLLSEKEVGYGKTPFRIGDSHGFIFHSADGSVNIYNAYMDTEADIVGYVHIEGPDGTELANEQVTIGVGCGTQPRWYKAPTASTPDLSLLPTYSTEGIPVSQYKAASGRDYSLMGLGISTTPNSAASGERDDLGLIPGWNVPYILDPSEENEDVVRMSGDSAAVWPIHFFDPETDEPVQIKDYPGVSTQGYFIGENKWKYPNPIKHKGTGPFSIHNTAHLTGFGIVESLVYGTEYDKLELACWANYCQLWSNPAYRNGGVGDRLLTNGQIRGRAWAIKQVAAAAKILNNEEFDRQVKASIAHATEYCLKNAPCITFPNTPGPYRNDTAFAPWQLHFILQSLGYLNKLGYDVKELADFLGKTVVDSMGVGSDTVCYQRSSSYNVVFRQEPKGTIVGTYEEAYKLSNFDDRKGCGHLFDGREGYEQGDMDGYPWSDTGYPAIEKGAIAACVDLGVEGAQEAWDLYKKHERITWENYKYNLVPTGDA